jgi:hypothetical protein
MTEKKGKGNTFYISFNKANSQKKKRKKKETIFSFIKKKILFFVAD